MCKDYRGSELDTVQWRDCRENGIKNVCECVGLSRDLRASACVCVARGKILQCNYKTLDGRLALFRKCFGWPGIQFDAVDSCEVPQLNIDLSQRLKF